MALEIIRGPAAGELLSQRAFADEWEHLRRQCPWSTAFQGFDFVSAWYQSYAGPYEPVIALARSAEGLLGVLPLAESASGASLSVAGDRQAEYQSWLCLPELAEHFAWEAIEAVRREFPGSRLRFRYLPPGVPLDWARHGPAGRVCKLEEHRRPLMRFGDGSEIDSSLAKKSNKSRLNRLRKIGPLEFVQATGDGFDIQLHTHRHRMPTDLDGLRKEIADNRQALKAIIGSEPVHLCYPSGIFRESQCDALREMGVLTATTCNAGLNDSDTPPLALSRFLDGNNISWIEFEAEMSGFAELCRSLARPIRRWRAAPAEAKHKTSSAKTGSN